jgi:hypothetical protein
MVPYIHKRYANTKKVPSVPLHYTVAKVTVSLSFPFPLPWHILRRGRCWVRNEIKGEDIYTRIKNARMSSYNIVFRTFSHGTFVPPRPSQQQARKKARKTRPISPRSAYTLILVAVVHPSSPPSCLLLCS